MVVGEVVRGRGEGGKWYMGGLRVVSGTWEGEWEGEGDEWYIDSGWYVGYGW